MSAEGEEPNIGVHFQLDPLLKSGAFINPTSNGYAQSDVITDPHVSNQDPSGSAEPIGSDGPSTPIYHPDYSDAGTPPFATPLRDQRGGSEPAGSPSLSDVPDWLPQGWRIESRVRSSGASAGTKDKYYVDPISNRRFRSKKEVLFFLETGQKKKRTANSDGDTLSANNSRSQKQKKFGSKVAALVENFDFEDVPAKVKWAMTDVLEGSWRPLLGVKRVAETAKQEWAAAFTYLSLQNGGGATL